ncbi:MAG: glycosyltransferase [Elusimicrobiales bacterium]
MIILRYLSNRGNCIENYNALNSAVFLNNAGNDVIIISKKDSYIKEFCKKNKVKYHELNFLILSGISRIPNADLVEIYSYSKEDDKFIEKLLSLKKPKIMRVFGFPDSDTREFIKKNEYSFSRIIVSCQSIKDELVFNQISPIRIMILSPLLVMSRWESAKQIKPFTIMQRPYRVGCVMRSFSEEEAKFFMLIAKNVLVKNNEVNFMIVGSRDERIREFARNLGISHKVDILGWRDDMPEVMAMLHIYVSTRNTPSVGRSLIEALASGVVCVVGNVGGISDFIKNDYTGIIINPRNIDEYVKNIVRLVGDPVTMQNISAMAFAYAKANFSAQIITKVEELVYEETVAGWISKYV